MLISLSLEKLLESFEGDVLSGLSWDLMQGSERRQRLLHLPIPCIKLPENITVLQQDEEIIIDHVKIPAPIMATTNMYEIMEKLLACDYPFRWQPRIELEIVPYDMVNRLTDQLNEKIFEDDFYFEHLMLYVGLSYEYEVDGKTEEAVKTLEVGKAQLREFIATLPSNISDAVQHLLSATEAHLLLQQGNVDRAFRVISEIPPADTMNADNRATLYGLRAVFFDEYGISGTKRALELASNAIHLSPSTSMWHFLKGKYLGRLRRVERPYEIPSVEEIELLKRANDARENPSYIIFTAQMYCETASRIYRIHRIRQTLYPSTKLLVDKLNQESLNLYNKAIELKRNCSHMMFRCAKGFIKLMALIDDKDLDRRTKQLLEEGLKIAPENGFGNHVMSQYYERIKKNVNKAIKFLRICEKQRIFGAAMDLLRLRYRSGEAMDLVQGLEDLLNMYGEKSRKCQVISQLISYHIFCLDDLDKACVNTYAIMDLNPNCDDMFQHRGISLRRIRKPINLYDVLVDEIKIRLQDEKCSEDRKNYYYKFLDDLSCNGLPVPLSKPLYVKNEILKASFIVPQDGRTRTWKKSSVSRLGKKRKKFVNPQYIRDMVEGSHTLHMTDVDQDMNEINSRCQEAFKKERENKPDPQDDYRSRPAPTDEECDHFEVTESHGAGKEVAHLSRDEVSTAGGNGESDESDDDAFRMIVYKKTKEESQQIHRNQHEQHEHTPDMSNSIMTPFKKLKIGGESSSDGESSVKETLKYLEKLNLEYDSDGSEFDEYYYYDADDE